ncbi:MAG: hypothetical protein J7L47_05370 [Candidatus Odinarchaeota archaeon]|nr:hypothetical protein [Candidatus Odinarchaeota archaeon]
MTEAVKNIDIMIGGLHAYILSGWKTLRKFIGPAVVTVMRDMGMHLYEYLLKAEIVMYPCNVQSLEDLGKYVLDICKACGIPVKYIHIKVQDKSLSVCFHEDVENCKFCCKLNSDEVWPLLPLPMFSFVYFIVYQLLAEKQEPYRFTYTYENNKWEYTLIFARPIDKDSLKWEICSNKL